MDWKKALRVALCLILVCALIVGISPIRAKAAYAPGFSEAMAVGLVIILFGMATGFIPPPTISMEQIEDVGEAFDYAIDDLVFDIQFPSGPSSPDDLDDDEKTELQNLVDKARSDVKEFGGTVIEQVGSGMSGIEPAADLGLLLGAFIYDLIREGVIDTQPDVDMSQGYVQMGAYNFAPYPAPVDSFPYVLVMADSVDTSSPERILFSTAPLTGHNTIPSDPSSGCFRLCASDALSYKDWMHFGNYSDGGHFYFSFTESPSNVFSASAGGYVTYNTTWCPGWSNYDLYDYEDGSLLLAASSGPFVYGTDIIEPIAEIGSLIDGIRTGGLTAADIPIPEKVDLSQFFEGVETGGLDAVLGNIQSSASGLASGSIALDDFRQSIVYIGDGSGDEDENPGEDSQDPTEDPSPTEGDDSGNEDGDTGEDDGGSDTQVWDGTLGNWPGWNFLSKLGELLQDIFDGNWLGVKQFYDAHFSGIRQDISDVDSSVQQGFQDVVESNQGIMDSVQDVVESNQQLQDINEQIAQEQNNIISQGFASVAGAVAGGISSAFVPSDGFFEQKVNDLCNEYTFANSIANTAKDMKSFLTNLGSVPPVVHVNLGASTTGYDLGGEVVLVDFSFYEPYKPQMDAILSAFLWLWFCWRVILNLPGIISGASGLIGSFSDTSGVGTRGYIELPDIPWGVTAAEAVPESVRTSFDPHAYELKGPLSYEAWRSGLGPGAKEEIVAKHRAESAKLRAEGKIGWKGKIKV